MDKSKRIANPPRFYKNVPALLNDDMLSHEEKIIALTNWNDICMHDSESTYEGMKGEQKTSVRSNDILSALRELEK